MSQHIVGRFVGKEPKIPYPNQKPVRYECHKQGKERFLLDAEAAIERGESCMVIGCNIWPNTPIDDTTRYYVRETIQPKEEFAKEINRFLGFLPPDYKVVHLRSGDSNLEKNYAAIPGLFPPTKNENLNEKRLSVLYNEIIKGGCLPKETLFVSDSQVAEAWFKEKWFMTVPGTPKHSALYEDAENTKRNLLCFFGLGRAAKVLQYSVYGWGSGFSKWITETYKVPLAVKPLPWMKT
jgi:hypothetical protein